VRAHLIIAVHDRIKEFIMKSYDLRRLAADEGGEYVLGMADLHTHACYLIYGMMKAGESDRLIRPGAGHEEILLAVDGPLRVHLADGEKTLEMGYAVHLRGEESFTVSNPTDRPVTYVCAGGHSAEGHHH
jgi:glyoxylate utilization-related uncharacterized protein